MKRIAELRKEKHLTQTSLAMKLNVTQNMISFYEKGKYQPGIEMLKDLSRIFDVSVDYLIENTDIRQRAEVLASNNSTTAEIAMSHIFKTLTEEEQRWAVGIIQAIKYKSADAKK